MIQTMWRRVLSGRTEKNREFILDQARTWPDETLGEFFDEKDFLLQEHKTLTDEEAEYIAALRTIFKRYSPPVTTLPIPERARAIMRKFLAESASMTA
jgi:hypothetical protein